MRSLTFLAGLIFPVIYADRISLRGIRPEARRAYDRLLQPGSMPRFENGTQFNCPWQASITAKTFNFAASDANAIYQLLAHFGVDSTKVLRISGTFPKDVRYFSYQTYRYTGVQNAENVTLANDIRDNRLVPASGVNIFNVPNPSPEDIEKGSTYVLHITPSGKEGLQNELRLLDKKEKDDFCEGEQNGCVAIVLLRFYPGNPGKDAILGGGFSDKDIWGGVDKPDAYIRNAKGEFDLIPPCVEGRPTMMQQVIQHRFKELQNKPFGKVGPHFTCQDNFVLFMNGTFLPNKDTAYLMALGALPENKTEDMELVARVQGELPIYSRGFSQPPYVGDVDNYDVRYTSFTVLWVSALSPLASSVSDMTLEEYYKGKQGGGEWDRKYTLAMASSPEVANKCQGFFQDSTDYFISSTPTYIDPQLTRPDTLGIILRQLAPTERFFNHSTQKIDADCRPEGKCRDPTYIQSVMGKFYPRVDWFYCNTKTGEMTNVVKQFPPQFGNVPPREEGLRSP